MSAAQSTPSQSSRSAFIVDLSKIDLNATQADREAMFKLIPHRHEMALFDRIVWASDTARQGVGVMKVRGDEFWVRGHFPNKPMLPVELLSLQLAEGCASDCCVPSH